MNASEEREAELAAGAAAFGRWLHHERELRGLPRDDVARLTGLTPALIEALESGDPVRMPPKAYVSGYLRAYAGVVGLDADDVILRWQEVVGPEETRATAPRRRRPQAIAALVAAVLGLAVLVAVAVALFSPPRQRAPLQLRKVPSAQRAPYPSAPLEK